MLDNVRRRLLKLELICNLDTRHRYFMFAQQPDESPEDCFKRVIEATRHTVEEYEQLPHKLTVLVGGMQKWFKKRR